MTTFYFNMKYRGTPSYIPPLLYSSPSYIPVKIGCTGFLRTPRGNPGPHGRSSPCEPQTYRAALWARMSPRLDPGHILRAFDVVRPGGSSLLPIYHENNIGQHLAKFLILVRFSDYLSDIGVFEVNISIFSIVFREIKEFCHL